MTKCGLSATPVPSLSWERVLLVFESYVYHRTIFSDSASHCDYVLYLGGTHCAAERATVSVLSHLVSCIVN